MERQPGGLEGWKNGAETNHSIMRFCTWKCHDITGRVVNKTVEFSTQNLWLKPGHCCVVARGDSC